MQFILSIETDAGTYIHGFTLGTDERWARRFAENMFATLRPRIGTRICTLGLMRDGCLVDTFDGDDWLSALLDRMYEEECND